jgi:hypothetical protein
MVENSFLGFMQKSVENFLSIEGQFRKKFVILDGVNDC